MAYSADSFVADEQPTTAKWNKLWTNDASFNDGTGIATGAITSAKISGIDKSLTTTDSNPYKFKVRRVAALSLGSSSFQKITFDTEDYDTNSNFTGGTYTAPVTGYYQFNARASFSATTLGLLALYKNGSIVSRGSHNSNSAGNVLGVVYNDIVSATAGDTFDIYAFYDGTGAFEVGTGQQPYFSGFLVSRT